MPATAKSTRKPSARKTTSKKPEYSLRNVAVASLGLYAKIFDEVQDRVEDARKEAPKTFNTLVKRGEKAQKDLLKARKDLRKNIKEEAEDAREQFEDVVDRVRDRVSPAKA